MADNTNVNTSIHPNASNTNIKKQEPQKVGDLPKTISSSSYLWDVIRDVGKGNLSMPAGEKIFRESVAASSEEDKEDFKKNARRNAEYLRQVCEAFSQMLTVMGAGQ